MFFVEGAVRNATLRLGTRVLHDPEQLGLLLVNSLVSHTMAWAAGARGQARHWKVGRHEVDMVFDHPDQPLALQIASSRRQAEDGLRALCRALPQFEGRCWLLLHRALPSWPRHHPSGLGRLPLLPFLLALGAALHLQARVASVSDR